MRNRVRYAALVCLLAACGGEQQVPRTATAAAETREKGAALEPDGQRIGYLLHERGMIENREVRARAQQAVQASRRGTAAADSASRAFRTWLEEWARTNPNLAAEAEAAQPKRLTPEQQHEQLVLLRVQREKERADSARASAPPTP